MAPHVPPSVKRPFAGQVVRTPNAGEGVGRALRDAYGQDMRLPGVWDQYLQRLDKWSDQ